VFPVGGKGNAAAVLEGSDCPHVVAGMSEVQKISRLNIAILFPLCSEIR